MLKLENGCFIRTDGTKIKRERFKPTNSAIYRSIKIMFHKLIPEYHFRNRVVYHFSNCYNGAGFMAYRYSNLKNKYINFNGYDINSAYQSVLVDNEFPLSDKYKRYDNIDITNVREYLRQHKSLSICWVELKDIKRKYEDFDYNIYYKQFGVKLDVNGGLIYYGWLTNIDLINLNKLYTYTNLHILACYEFLEVGKFDKRLANYIKSLYNNLHDMPRGVERTLYKTMLHVCTYGKSAQMYDYGRRSPYVVIAMFQVAYVRDLMIKAFIKYNKDTLYIDTDSIFLKKRAKFRETVSAELGAFKHEYKDSYVYIFRGKGYFVFDKHKKLIKQVVSGVNVQLTAKEIDKIYKGIDFHKKITVQNETINYLITNKYLNGYKLKI